MMSTFKSLHILNYRIWFIGALVSNIGTWMQRTAQDWLDRLGVGSLAGARTRPSQRPYFWPSPQAMPAVLPSTS